MSDESEKLAKELSENLGTEHIDSQGRLNVPMTCFFDKPPVREGWRVVWSIATGDAKWPRLYRYKKSEIKEDEHAAERIEGATQEDE